MKPYIVKKYKKRSRPASVLTAIRSIAGVIPMLSDFLKVTFDKRSLHNRGVNAMKKKIIWSLGAGIILVFFMGLLFLRQGTAVDTSEVVRGDIKKYVEDTGTVKCKDTQSISIEGSGLILSLPVDVGQVVQKGDILLTMDKSQLEIQLKEADEKVKEMQANFQDIKVQDLNNVQKARIALEQANEAYSNALNTFNSTQILYDAGAVSQDELNQKKLLLTNAKGALNVTQIDLDKVEKDSSQNIQAVYKAQLEQAVLSQTSVQLSLKKQEIISPVAGVILERNVEANTIGVPGTVAFVIGDPKNIEIDVNILADDVTNIKIGNEVEITEGSKDKQVIKGRAVKIAPSAMTVTSSLGVNQKKVLVTIEPLEKPELLRPGYEVNIKVITERKNNIILVPVTSLFDYKGKRSIFVVEKGKAVLKSVQTGIQDESFIEIVDGLKEGEIVISEPDNSIKEGMRIKM